MNIRIMIYLIRIINVDHDAQEFELDIWMHYFFVDPRLAWNAEDFPDLEREGNMAMIKVDPAMVWLPDFTLKNSATGSIGSLGIFGQFFETEKSKK